MGTTLLKNIYITLKVTHPFNFVFQIHLTNQTQNRLKISTKQMLYTTLSMKLNWHNIKL